jgi:hypothetical protein
MWGCGGTALPAGSGRRIYCGSAPAGLLHAALRYIEREHTPCASYKAGARVEHPSSGAPHPEQAERRSWGAGAHRAYTRLRPARAPVRGRARRPPWERRYSPGELTPPVRVRRGVLALLAELLGHRRNRRNPAPDHRGGPKGASRGGRSAWPGHRKGHPTREERQRPRSAMDTKPIAKLVVVKTQAKLDFSHF